MKTQDKEKKDKEEKKKEERIRRRRIKEDREPADALTNVNSEFSASTGRVGQDEALVALWSILALIECGQL